ncbi:MAG: Mur ligase family protein [Candidatus Andersenbacteria bacterium]
MKRFLRHLEWARAIEYVNTYDVNVIGITGCYHLPLVADAVGLAIGHTRSVQVSSNVREVRDIPEAILGITPEQGFLSWMRVLSRSRLKEVLEEEPTTIVVNISVKKPGDIDMVGNRIPPHVAVIANADAVNLEQFISRENVVHELMSLAVSVPPEGTVVLNIDDPLLEPMKERVSANVITYGEHRQATVRLLRATRVERGFAVEIQVAGEIFEQHLPGIIGRHQLSAILAALAVVWVQKGDIAVALREMRRLNIPRGNLTLHKAERGIQVLIETANASPHSIQLALRTFAALSAGRHIVVLGEIPDLGAEAIGIYKALGNRAATAADILVTIGHDARHAQEAALNVANVDTHHFSESADAAKWIGGMAHSRDAILIAGSSDTDIDLVADRLL